MPSKIQRAWAEVDLSAVAYNLSTLWQGRPERAAMPVVKANAYGHGAVPVAQKLRDAGAGAFAVATTDEAAELRDAAIDVPIVLLGAFTPEDCPEILDLDLTPSVSSVAFAETLDAAARERGLKASVHIEIDTGMGRLGIPSAKSIESVERIAVLPNLSLDGIYTHFAESESADKSFTMHQLEEFSRILARLEGMGINFPCRHAANSAACLEVPESLFDCIRPGLSLYGVHPGPRCGRNAKLKPALEFCARIVNIERRPAGATIGYCRTCRLERDSLVAVVSAGYADGYDRRLSGRGVVLVRGAEASVLGRVSMDLISIDVTDIPEVALGDKVVLYSADPGAPNSIDNLCRLLDTIPHVLMCDISARVPRIYKS